MMLTKEECENFLSETKIYLKNQMQKKERIRHSVYLLNTITYLFEKLIHEHFDNPPLEWEELKECNVVYDKEQKKYRLIEDILESGKRIVFTNTIDSFITENYESNRFYRKHVIQ